MKNRMLSFTASYTNCAHNFCISGFPAPTLANDITEIGFACVLFNLLHRGERTTKPTEYLKASLGEFKSDKRYYLAKSRDKGSMPNWYRTIKGGEDGNNPARYFFEKLWLEYLPEHAWLRQFVIAEAQIELLLSDNSGKWREQAVDFYFAPAKLVIEIDGGQHSEQLQRMKDKERDAALLASGMTVIRFTTAEIQVGNQSFQRKIEELNRIFTGFDNDENIITEAKECNDTALSYEQVMRYQILILSLIRENCLSITQAEWRFDIPNTQQELFSIAAEDLFLWFENLYTLVKKPFSRPEIIFKKENSIKVNNNIFERLDDSYRSTDEINIFTDYYDDMDYFHAATNGALIRYEVDWPISKEQKSAFLFILKNLFQYGEFNPGQLSIIAHAITLKDTIGILPTGSGKSLCYYLCCLLQPAPSFAICPIISLLMDQEKNLREFGVTRVAAVSSMQTTADKDQCIEKFGAGKYLLIWISPERFQNDKFREQLQNANHNYMVGYAVIDEVHCLSEWGHDFRTSYLTLIKTIRKYTPQAVLFGLTATASQSVLVDLKNEFEIDNTGVKATHSMGRAELRLQVKNVGTDIERNKELGEILSDKAFADKERKGLIFTQTKKQKRHSKKYGCIILRDLIRELRPDLSVGTFHGDLSNYDKKIVQDAFMSDKIDVMTATKAFGMGINKKDIRYTIHYGMPMSIESFYQEAGRAGRDHDSAECIILYTPDKPGPMRNTLFERAINSVQLKKAARYMHGDLGTLFFLWQLNNKGVEQDVKEVEYFLSLWFDWYQSLDSFDYYCTPHIDEITQEKEHDQAATERVLYHLKLLGLVEDWTIQQFEMGKKNCVIHVCMNNGNLNVDSVRKHFLDYIKKYDPLFEAEANEDKNKKYFEIINRSGGRLMGYAEALITWMYEHIGYTRRVAIRNLLELCENYKDPDTFRDRIEDYLKIDEKSSLLDEIALHPENWKLWFEAFQDIEFNEGSNITKLLTEQGFVSLAMSTARYLESYADNAGLDLVYLVSKAISGSIDNSIDIERLERLIDSIVNSTSYTAEADDILEELIGTLKPYKHKQSVPLFCGAICEFKPQYSERIYAIFEDDYSLSTYLMNVTAQINTYIGSVNT